MFSINTGYVQKLITTTKTVVELSRIYSVASKMNSYLNCIWAVSSCKYGVNKK